MQHATSLDRPLHDVALADAERAWFDELPSRPVYVRPTPVGAETTDLHRVTPASPRPELLDLVFPNPAAASDTRLT